MNTLELLSDLRRELLPDEETFAEFTRQIREARLSGAEAGYFVTAALVNGTVVGLPSHITKGIDEAAYAKAKECVELFGQAIEFIGLDVIRTWNSGDIEADLRRRLEKLSDEFAAWVETVVLPEEIADGVRIGKHQVFLDISAGRVPSSPFAGAMIRKHFGGQSKSGPTPSGKVPDDLRRKAWPKKANAAADDLESKIFGKFTDLSTRR